MRRLTLVLVVPVLLAACSDDKAASPPTSTAPPTVCVTTAAPDGRLVHVTLDDIVGGFGSLGSRANSGLTPGVIRVELEADAENAGPASIRIMKAGAEVATITGVVAGATCGIDLSVTAGTYQVLGDADQDTEFEVTAGD
ncbi:MAG TPA: hypothetical protein PK020_21435 [Ilumatobacteraceae bacterium]|nr:hypothetical protein [Ilumatobacteraceae bacterium]HRB04935.1 hypothetical protein [Ilumatobacteraceae bacterium]